jgi:hypothetical protein
MPMRRGTSVTAGIVAGYEPDPPASPGSIAGSSPGETPSTL